MPMSSNHSGDVWGDGDILWDIMQEILRISLYIYAFSAGHLCFEDRIKHESAPHDSIVGPYDQFGMAR
jgi:hypothetical protein